MQVAIFTRNKNDKLLALIDDLSRQVIKPSITVYSDENFSYPWINIVLTKNKNIAQKRNLAIENASENEYLFLLDDDNRILDKNFLKKLVSCYENIKYTSKIISPVIYYRTSLKIQSAGISFSYIFWKIFVNTQVKWDFFEVEAIWGNSLFGKGKDFKLARFDEKIWFIREDVDFAYSFREKWGKIFVVNLPIYHMERDKTWAEKSFLVWEAFEKKVKNRDIFVAKHWNWFEKFIYWLFGRWFSLMIWYGKKIIG